MRTRRRFLEAEASYSLHPAEILGQHISVGMVGKGAVESGIENSHVRHVRPQFLSSPDVFGADRIMQGRKPARGR